MEEFMSVFNNVITILAFVFSVFTLYITLRDKQSYMRINANSNKLSFVVDLENSGPNLAYIKNIKAYSRGDERKLFAKPVVNDTLGFVKLIRDEAIAKGVEESHIVSRSCTELAGDVVIGNGTKHHIFSCTVTELSDLKIIWEILSQYEIKVIYRDMYGLLTVFRKKCYSHFKIDYDAFDLALGSRSGFTEKNTKG